MLQQRRVYGHRKRLDGHASSFTCRPGLLDQPRWLSKLPTRSCVCLSRRRRTARSMTFGRLAAKLLGVPEPEYSDDYTDPRLAIFYDQLNPWGSDLDFYLDLVMAAESVLDVGCGTGSVLRKARASGHTGRLVGLGPAPAMRNQAKTST